MVQTWKTGSTISRLWPALPDHARMPVMLPRESDSDMCRDGSSAASGRPDNTVDEPGRVRGVPELECFVGLRRRASNSAQIHAMEEKWRWRRLAENQTQIRGRDKRLRGAVPFSPGRRLVSQGFLRGNFEVHNFSPMWRTHKYHATLRLCRDVRVHMS